MSKRKSKIHLIAGARPNFIKLAPLYHELKKEDWAFPIIVHTGQHYDLNMSGNFFKDLDLIQPHINFGVGSGLHGEQVAKIMIAYEKLCVEDRPDLCVVMGDVNSTVACVLVAVKLGIKTAHLEAGLRSFDKTMPEEVNRIVTDVIANMLWTPSRDADENLLREGVAPEKIKRVGNIMIDSFENCREAIENNRYFTNLKLNKNGYCLVTLHRPSNVDGIENLSKICEVLIEIGKKIPVIFPVHPRTRTRLKEYNLLSSLEKCSSLKILEPLSYLDSMNLVMNAKFVLTDSGGLQEETTYLGIPCLTLRPNTERPITVTEGTNKLATVSGVIQDIADIFKGRHSKGKVPDLWDGHTANRVVSLLKEEYNSGGI